MAGTDYVIAPQIPRGLAPAIEGLAREILRKRPRDIYTFAARHFEQLVKLRDRERGVKSLDRKSYKNEYVFDWIDRNDVEARKRVVKDLRRYTRSLNEDAIAKGQRIISTIRQAKSTRRREASNESGWSINRTVKVFKEHEEGERARAKPARKLIREPRVIEKFTRSGGTLINVKRPVDKLYKSAGEEHRQVSSNSLKRQKSADQIEASENGALFVNRRRSRSLANNEDGYAENGRRWCAEELPRSWKEEAAVKLSLRPDKKNGEEAKDAGEKYTIESRSNNVFDQAIVNVTTVVSVVLPSVVTRQSSGNSVRSEPRESNDECKSSLVLPPITVDPCKLIKRESNLTLPSLSNEADSCPASSAPEREETEPTNLGDEVEGKKEIQSLEHLSKNEETVDTDKLGEPQHGLDVAENLPGAEGSTNLATEVETEKEIVQPQEYLKKNGETVEAGALTETQDRLNLTKNLLEVETEEHFQDSLNVTPDPIDHSQRADSLEQIETENKDEAKLEEGPNELKRKLIEIEMVEKSIESALASSRSNASFDREIQATSIEQDRGSSSREEKESRVDDQEKQTKEGETKSDRAGDKDSPKENEEEIEEVLEVPVTSDVDANVLEEFMNESNNDPSCYVLKGGSPCKIPETVTTVIIPDRVPSEIEDLNAIDGPSTAGEPEKYRHDERFGEYIGPEARDYPSEVDAQCLRDVKNAAYQNLGNIKEEEEGNDSANKHDFDLLSSRPLESADEDSVESDERSAELRQTNTGDVKEDKSLQISIKTAGKETEDRSSELSLSLDRSGPQIPELNLDSLQDLTVSSFERNDSKNLETEKENDSTTAYEEENGSLSYSENSSERKSSGKVQSKEVMSEPGDKPVITDVYDVTRDESAQSLEEEIAKELIENFIRDESIHKTNIEEEGSERNVEESDDTKKMQDSSQELINVETVGRENEDINNDVKKEEEGIREIESNRNELSEKSDLSSESKIIEPIEENSHQAAVQASEGQEEEVPEIKSSRSNKVEELSEKSDLNSESKMIEPIKENSHQLAVQASEGQEEEIQEIESSRSNKMEELSERSDLSSESKLVEPIKENSYQLAVEAISKEAEEKKIEVEEREGVQIEELKDEEEKEEIEETLESHGEEEQGPFIGYRHTGEFHDSIPLPVIEFPKHFYSRTSIVNDEENASIPTTSFLDSNPELTVPYIIDLLGKYRSQDKRPSLAGFINIAPYIIRFENVLHEPQTADKPVVSVAETSSSFSSDTDDLREPLALDNTPQPVIIEEITNDDDDDGGGGEEKEGSRVTP